MNGKRTTEEICENGVQERVARVQEDEAEDRGEEEEFSEEEIKEIFYALYQLFQPRIGT
jgi:hypothetical protein